MMRIIMAWCGIWAIGYSSNLVGAGVAFNESLYGSLGVRDQGGTDQGFFSQGSESHGFYSRGYDSQRASNAATAVRVDLEIRIPDLQAWIDDPRRMSNIVGEMLIADASYPVAGTLEILSEGVDGEHYLKYKFAPLIPGAAPFISYSGQKTVENDQLVDLLEDYSHIYGEITWDLSMPPSELDLWFRFWNPFELGSFVGSLRAIDASDKHEARVVKRRFLKILSGIVLETITD